MLEKGPHQTVAENPRCPPQNAGTGNNRAHLPGGLMCSVREMKMFLLHPRSLLFERARQRGREAARGPFSKFTWRLRDESAGAIIFGEMHINISLMEGLELLLWYSNNILRGARSTKAVKYKGRANALIFGYSPLSARSRGRT